MTKEESIEAWKEALTKCYKHNVEYYGGSPGALMPVAFKCKDCGLYFEIFDGHCKVYYEAGNILGDVFAKFKTPKCKKP
jgi:hypothetical protein